ncbi:hypothetical protein KJ937_01000 [Patescibacteria group bacterium]|nr:hypothetical protein [Patescibacteria group bacterium]
MRHFSIISLFVVAFLLGCSVSPGADEDDGSGGAAGATSDGGKTAAGGAGGSTPDGGSGGTGGVAQGGTGGKVESGPDPAKFSCDDVADGHAAVKMQLPNGAPVPDAYLVIDGMKKYPENSGFTSCGWCNIHVSKDKGVAHTVFDQKVPGTTYMLAPGSSETKEPYETPNKEKVVATAWFCSNYKCGINILLCNGTKEVGKHVDGKSTGEIVWNAADSWSPAGKHIMFVTE